MVNDIKNINILINYILYGLVVVGKNNHILICV